MDINLEKFRKAKKIKRTINITSDEMPYLDVLKKHKINISAFCRFCIKQLAMELNAEDDK